MADARVVLEEDALRLDLPERSPLLSGVHRIYFLNVLGFEVSAEPLGYIITSHPSAPSLLQNVVEYLREQGLETEFNERAKKTLDLLQVASSDLVQGGEAGRAHDGEGAGDRADDQGQQVEGAGFDTGGFRAGVGAGPGRVAGGDQAAARFGFRDRHAVHELPDELRENCH